MDTAQQEEKLKQYAKAMRRQMTKEEQILWFNFLKGYVPRIRRQSIRGNYIVDFCCEKAKIIIELDGSQHYETEGKKYDAKRTEILEEMGYRVIRISNLEICRNLDGVKKYLDREIKTALQER